MPPVVTPTATVLDSVVTSGPAWVQAVAAVVVAVLAWQSLEWARRTFKQREELEAAKETPHFAFRLEWLQQAANGPFLPDPDYQRVSRWRAVYVGNGRDLKWVNAVQQVTCFVTCLGPGTIASAEVPFHCDVFDDAFGRSETPAEGFDGTFHFYFVPPGQVRYANIALNTGFFPRFVISIGQPIVRNVRGVTVEVPADKAMSVGRLEFDNLGFWRAIQSMPAPPSGAEAPKEGAS